MEFLKGIHHYLLAFTGDDRKSREEMVIKYVGEAGKDVFLQRYAYSLEHIPFVTKDLNKIKGLVSNYESDASLKFYGGTFFLLQS